MLLGPSVAPLKYGVRWQSEAPTPLWAAQCAGGFLPPAEKPPSQSRRAVGQDGIAAAPGSDNDLALDCRPIKHGRGGFLGEPRVRITMRPVTYKCPVWIFSLLLAGAIAPLAFIPLIPALGWPPVTKLVLNGVEVAVVLYALTLLPTKVVISDDGLWQKLLFSELRLRWEDMVEWRHCDGGAEYEEAEMRERTRNKLHSKEFWIRDRTGKKYHLKRWLVFGKRSKQVAEIMRERGIEGG